MGENEGQGSKPQENQVKPEEKKELIKKVKAKAVKKTKEEKKAIKKILRTERIKFSLRKKISYLIILLISGIMIISAIIILNNQKAELTRQFVLRAKAIAITLADSVQVHMMDKGIGGSGRMTRMEYEMMIGELTLNLKDIIDSILEQENIVGAVVINKNSEVLLHSNNTVKTFDKFVNYNGLPLYAQQYTNGKSVIPKTKPYSGRFYNSRKNKRKYEKGDIMDVSYPIVSSRDKKDKRIDRRNGEVHIYISKKEIAKTILLATAQIEFIALIAIGIGVLASIALASIIVGPIKKLVSAMRKVATGDLHQNVKVRSKDEVGMLARNFNKMTEGLREKEKIKNTFNKFVSEEIAQQVLSNEGEMKLGGDYKRVTMFFSDIRSFTSISEKMTPEEVLSMLNSYLSLMTDIVLKHKGVIDKYVGDEIMAVYGAPITHGDDALNAVKTAVEQLKVLKDFNDQRKAEGQVEIRAGIGINTGDVISGNMGSEKRMDYTVIGDNVNLASRLCDTAGKKGLKHILIAESTYEEVKDQIIVNEVEPIYVKGKEKPVKIYEVLDVKEGV